jgi:FixJ family two-component response regulator
MQESSAKTFVQETPSAKQLVFVVGRDPTVAAGCAKLLTWYGFNASAYLPFEALDAAHSSTPDLLITDAVMPGISGLDLAARLRGICPACKVVLVAFPAMVDHIVSSTAEVGHAGFECLARPVVCGELVYVAQRMLDINLRECS